MHDVRPHEHINVGQLEAVIGKVSDMVAEAAEDTVPRFEYIERTMEWGYWHRCILPRLPKRYMDIYEELLCLYYPEELEAYRRTYGNRALIPLYEENFGALPRARCATRSTGASPLTSRNFPSLETVLP